MRPSLIKSSRVSVKDKPRLDESELAPIPSFGLALSHVVPAPTVELVVRLLLGHPGDVVDVGGED